VNRTAFDQKHADVAAATACLPEAEIISQIANWLAAETESRSLFNSHAHSWIES
jgi:hypothetical protein